MDDPQRHEFYLKLTELLASSGMANRSKTEAYILAQYLMSALDAFDEVMSMIDLRKKNLEQEKSRGQS